jgi:hypothetical protein
MPHTMSQPPGRSSQDLDSAEPVNVEDAPVLGRSSLGTPTARPAIARGFMFGLLGVLVLTALWAGGNIWLGEDFHEGVEGSFSMMVALGGGALIGLLVAVGTRGRTRAVSGVVAIQAVLAVAVAELMWPVFEAWRDGRDVEVLAIALQHLSDVLADGWIAFNVAAGLVFAALGGSAVLGWLGATGAREGA